MHLTFELNYVYMLYIFYVVYFVIIYIYIGFMCNCDLIALLVFCDKSIIL